MVSAMNADKNRLKLMMSQLNTFMREKKLPQELRVRMREFVKYQYEGVRRIDFPVFVFGYIGVSNSVFGVNTGP